METAKVWRSEGFECWYGKWLKFDAVKDTGPCVGNTSALAKIKNLGIENA